MLFKKKLFCPNKINIGSVILKLLCLVTFILIIVLFSKYCYEASSLRNWRGDEIDYAPTNYNQSIYQDIYEYFKTLTSGNKIRIENSTTTLNVDIRETQEYRNITDAADGEEVADTAEIEEPDNAADSEEPDNAAVSEKAMEPCKPEPPKDDYRECGTRIADKKCCEYIWELKYKKELMERRSCLSDDYGVVGGKKAQPGEFPHMAAVGFKCKDRKLDWCLRNTYHFKCGGTLISETFVLTAGHCTRLARQPAYKPEPHIVRLGGENINSNDPNLQDFLITKIIKHPKYKPPKIYYDIALLRLKRKVEFTYSIHPACLSTELFTQAITVNVTGWGVTEYGSDTISDHLLVASLSIVDHDICLKTLETELSYGSYGRHFKKLHRHQLCAGASAGIDSCQGDSGGPLQERINRVSFGNIHRVYGVTSFGFKCATGRPSIYVKVSAVLSWIESVVWPEYKVNGHKPTKIK